MVSLIFLYKVHLSRLDIIGKTPLSLHNLYNPTRKRVFCVSCPGKVLTLGAKNIMISSIAVEYKTATKSR